MVDFNKLKNGQKVEKDGVEYSVCVSKGRKMLQRIAFVKSEGPIPKKIRGHYHNDIKRHYYKIVFFTDFGVEYETMGRFFYPSESYDLPSGRISSNKWDIYNQLKK